MPVRGKSFSMDHPIVITFLLLAIVWAMAWAAEVLRPLALAVLLSFALQPLSRFLEKRGLARGLAVVLTVVTVLTLLGGVAYVVTDEFRALATGVPHYEVNIRHKIQWLRPRAGTALAKAINVATDVAESLEQPANTNHTVNVRVVSDPTLRERITATLGPSLQFLGLGVLVLILVLFLSMNRENLRDRIIHLFGRGRITVTTRTMDEVGQRISRYLAVLAGVNSCFGIVVGLVLQILGVPYAVLWGFLAAVLRFIPYVGPTVALLLPVLFSVAYFPNWGATLRVLAALLVLEFVANSFVEPIIYGRTTGVSALGLLVAAMFWTWLWGPLGLLLSTPLTVCLAVLGKYVPALAFFDTLLGEESELDPDLRFYHRVLALDQDGATELVEKALESQPRLEVFDTILIPALARAERDLVRAQLDERELEFVGRTIDGILDDLEASAPARAAQPGGGAQQPPPFPTRVAGVTVGNDTDRLIMRMLAQVLAPAQIGLEIHADGSNPLKLTEQIKGSGARALFASHALAVGLAPARYLVRRLRAVFPEMPIVVGCWSQSAGPETEQPLQRAGATAVVFRLADARAALLERLAPELLNSENGQQQEAKETPAESPAGVP